MNQRRPLTVKITLGQARTLEVLLNTQLMISEDHNDLKRYRAIREAVSRGIALSLYRPTTERRSEETKQ